MNNLDVSIALDIYNQYIKIAEFKERFKPFDELLKQYGLEASIFIKHIPLLRKMNDANSFDRYYDKYKKEIKEHNHLVYVPLKEWFTSCKEQDIISVSEFNLLLELLESLTPKAFYEPQKEKLTAEKLENMLEEINISEL